MNHISSSTRTKCATVIRARRYPLVTGLCVLACLIPRPGLLAQQAEPLILEEVIVTATKREASLQDVAVAVTAVPDWVLTDNQIATSQELSNLVPSLTVQGGDTRTTSFNVRGIGTRSFSSAAEPSVSTMVDGVVLGRSGMAFAQLPDVQRVEVLRGPQGTLFGKNASAGLVHIITKDPTPEHEGEIDLMAIEENEYRIGATAAGPIGYQWGYRLTASYIDDKGYIDNRYDPNAVDPGAITLNASEDTYNGKEDTLLRGKLGWQPTDNLDLMYTGGWNKRTSHPSPTVRRADDPSPFFPLQVGDENDEVNLDGPGKSTTDSSNHQLDIDWHIGSHTLTSISAYRDWDLEEISDQDGQPVLAEPLKLIQGGSSQQRQFSQELRLTSAANQTVSYVLGLYYFNQNIERQFDRTVSDNRSLTSFDVDSINYAAFGEATWNITESWRLIFGARYTRDELSYNDYIRFGGPSPVETPASDDTSASDLSGKLVLQWDFSDTAMTYLSFAQGYKGPAYSIDAGTDVANLEPVDPETSDAFELGLKSSLFDQRVNLNAAVFYTRFKDWQAEAFVPDGSGVGGAGTFKLSNAGQVSTRGVELDITAIPVENMTLYTAVAYIDAVMDEFEGGSCNFQQQAAGVPPECGSAPHLQDLSGGDMPYSPDWRVTVSANYLLPLESLPFGLAFTGTYRWQSEVQFDVTQDPNTIQDAYGILDLAMTLGGDREHHSVTAFVKNVADQFYVDGIVPTHPLLIAGGYMQRVPKYARRTVGLEYRYRWF